MILPYSSDSHNGTIGWFSLGTIVVCVIAFALSWSDIVDQQVSVATDSTAIWEAHELQQISDSIYQEAHPGVILHPPVDSAPLAKATDSSGTPEVPDPSSEFGEMPSMANRDTRVPGEAELDQLLLREKAKTDPQLKALLKERMKAHELKSQKSSPLGTFGFTPSGRWFPNILTSMYMHADWGHLAGNMVFFFAFGVALEHWFGMPVFIAFYLGGGIFASLALVFADYTLTGHLSSIPMVGASGAIAATMGGYMRLMPQSRIKVLVFYGFKPRTGSLPAWVFLGIWLLGQILSTIFLTSGEGGVGYAAHVGGFIFGLVAAHFLPRDPANMPMPELRPTVDREGIVVQMVTRVPIDEAWDHLRAGRTDQAREQFTRQFHEWMRQGEKGTDSIAVNIERLLLHDPLFRFDALPAFEWGVQLSKTRHLAPAMECLQMAADPGHPLPAGLARRRDELIQQLAAARIASAPPTRPAPNAIPQDPNFPQMRTAHSAAPPPPPIPDKKDWLIH